MADLAGCSLHTLKASENRLSTTFRILFKHNQICFEKSVVQTITVSFIAVCSPWILNFMFASVVPVTLRVFCLGGLTQFREGKGISLHGRWLFPHTSHWRLEVPWSRARVRSKAGSLKIPQDQLICSEPMHDKKTLRVTDTTEANTKFEIHGLQTTVFRIN